MPVHVPVSRPIAPRYIIVTCDMAASLSDLCLSNLCKTRLPVYSIRKSVRPQLVPERLERLLSRNGSGELPYPIVTQLVAKLSEEGTLSARILSLLLRQSRGRLRSLQLNLTQMTFDEFRRLPPIFGLVDFDCSYVDHVTNALWQNLCPSRSCLHSFAAIGLDNPAFEFKRIVQFVELSSLKLGNTCVAIDDVLLICQNLGESLTTLDLSECAELDFLSILPGIRQTRKLDYLSVRDLPVAKAPVADKGNVLATFREAFDCLSLLTFLDLGWIKDAGTLTGWDVACAIVERRGSGLTHLDVSGLSNLRQILVFVKELGIERNLKYLGALHLDLPYPFDFDKDYVYDCEADCDAAVYLSDDLAAEVKDLKIVGTGFRNVNPFILCQPHYAAFTPRNNAIFRLIGACMIFLDDLPELSVQQERAFSLFLLSKSRALRSSKGRASFSCPLLGYLAVITSIDLPMGADALCKAVLPHLIQLLRDTQPQTAFASAHLCSWVTEALEDEPEARALEQLQVALYFVFCHFVRGNFCEIIPILSALHDGNFLRDVAINQGFAGALIGLLESSLALRHSRQSHSVIEILPYSDLLRDPVISRFIGVRISRLSDDLCHLFDTLDEENVRQAESLINALYFLSFQKSNCSLLLKPAVLSLIWKSLNYFDANDGIQCFAAELFASLTFKSSTPFSGASKDYGDAEIFWQRIAEHCEHLKPQKVHDGAIERGRGRHSYCEKYSLQMSLSFLEQKDRATSQIVFALWSAARCLSYVRHILHYPVVVTKKNTKRLLCLVKADACHRNAIMNELVEYIRAELARGFEFI